MSSANALVIIPEEMKQIEKGNKVQALMLDWNEAFNLDS
jgi:molybdopterin biosynthesis enzyme